MVLSSFLATKDRIPRELDWWWISAWLCCDRWSWYTGACRDHWLFALSKL